jgi:beta-glucosidase
LHRDDRTAAELVAEALKIANQSDVIVAALGESAEMSGESSSRTNLEIYKHKKDLLQELLKRETLLVLFTGRP